MKTRATGAAGFLEMIRRGRWDNTWGVAKNFKRVHIGDQIVVYASKVGKKSPLLIGLGTVEFGPYDDGWKHPVIDIDWDERICLNLGSNPQDATWLAARLPVTKYGVTAIPPSEWPRLRRDLLAPRVASVREDIEELSEAKLSRTTRQQLIEARLGQGDFRQRVASIEPRCRITGVASMEHLRASHIRPWSESSNEQRLDGNNGLLLAPHVDHLFDRGYISFTDQGKVLVSSDLDPALLKAWHLPLGRSTGRFRPAQAAYLAYHRQHCFRR